MMPREKSIVVLVDGVNPKQMNMFMPFLKKFAKANYSSAVVSLLGYSSGIHPTIWTGKYQEEHGLFTTFYYDPRNSPFRWTRWLKTVPTHFLRKNLIAGIKAPYFWFPPVRPLLPGFVKKKIIPLPPAMPADTASYFSNKKGKAKQKTIFDLLKKKCISFSKQSDSDGYFGRYVKLEGMSLTSASVDFFYMYYGDELGHIYGPYSEKTGTYLRKADVKIKELFEKAKVWNKKVNLIIFSDHGMCEVRKFVDVQTALQKTGLRHKKDYIAFYDSTMARFWPRDKRSKDIIIKTLSKLNGITFLDKNLLKKYHIDFKDKKKYGELIFLADPQTRIYPDYFAPIKGGLKGWHGFDPEFPESKGILVSSFPIKAKQKKEIKIVDIFPLLKRALFPS